MQELTNFKILLNEQRIRLDNYARELSDISSGLATIGRLLSVLSQTADAGPDSNYTPARPDSQSFPPRWDHGAEPSNITS